jgi:hypothetical protein
MSNLSDLLKSVAAPNTAAIDVIGNSLGTLADLSGGVAAVAGAIGLFVSQDNKTEAELEKLQTVLKANFDAIKEDLKANNILTWENSFAQPVADARSVLQNLPAALSASPPVSNEFKLAQIGICLAAVDQFDFDPKWKKSYLDEVYFDPSNDYGGWGGPIAPTADADGTVFTDRYILPLFLRVLSIFVAVAAAYDQNYRNNYADALRAYTRRLKYVHDISMDGIQIIRLPTIDEAALDITRPVFTPEERYLNYTAWTFGFAASTYWWPGAWIYFQFFGVVHSYSGFSSLGNYPPIPKANENSVALAIRAARFYARLAFANRARWKDVYIGVGLADVWDTINTLRKLTSDPPQPAFNPGRWWSLREVYGLLGDAYKDPSASGEVRAYATIARLTWLVKFGDGPAANDPITGATLSWRSALSAAMMRTSVPDPGIYNDF